MHESHPAKDPVRFLAPVQFLAHRAKWSARKILPQCSSLCHIRVTSPVRLDAAVYLWLDRKIRRTPHGPRAVPVWASYGPCTGTPMVIISYGTRTGTAWDPQGHPYGQVRESTQPEFAKIPYGRRIWPYGARTGPLRSPHGLVTGCLRSLHPSGPFSL